MAYEMSVVDVPETHVIAIRGAHPAADVPAFIGTAFDDLFGHLGRLGIEAGGAPVRAVSRLRAAWRGRRCLRAGRRSDRDGRSHRDPPPAAGHLRPDAARRPVCGPLGRLCRLTEWVDDHAFRPDGPVRERYLNGPGDTTTPDEYRTEIEMPVAPVHATEPALAGR